MTISVALIDDQTLVRDGIRSLLELSDEVEVVAEAPNGSHAIEIANTIQPDVMLLDIQMPQMNGIEALQQLSAANVAIPCIILTTFDDHELVLQGIKAGAKGYLLKDVSLERLIETIKAVHAGQTVMQPAITETLLKGLDRSQQSFEALPEPDALSPKETEVLRLIASGYSNREISGVLNKSEGTIKNHVSSVLSKLGVRDRTRAVLRALELELI